MAWIFWDLRVDGVEEADEPLVAMALRVAADRRAKLSRCTPAGGFRHETARSHPRCSTARAQQPGKLPVIGFLNFTSAAGSVQRIRAFTRSPTAAEQR
jgi:hypothetical protein